MMWRLFNFFFGFHYAVLRSSMLDYRYVLRVRQDARSDLYVVFHGDNVWWLRPDGKADNGYSWRPLTW